IIVQTGPGAYTLLPGTLQCVGTAEGTGNLFLAIYPVSIACQTINVGCAVQGDRRGQQKLHIATATALATQGHGGFSAREQDAGSLGGLPVFGHAQGNAGHDLADLAGLALNAVAQQDRVDTAGLGDPSGSLQSQLRRGYQMGGDMSQARVIG